MSLSVCGSLFILPGIGQGGGARVVFQVANKLKMLGFDVNIIFPKTPYTFSKDDSILTKRTVRNPEIEHLLVSNENVFDIRANLIQVPYISDEFIPDGIATIATAWPTAYSVNGLDDRKGEKFYFIQHYEVWQGPADVVNESYRLGLGNIVIADWLRDKMKELGAKTVGKVRVPYDNNIFFSYPKKRKNSELRILMNYRPEHKWKGAEDGLEAYRIVKNKFSNVKLVTYGPAGSILDKIRGSSHPMLSDSDLRDLYNSCDILLFPSWTEGNPLPPMEAMACGLAVCTTNCTGISEYAKHNSNSLISPIKNPKALAENLEKVITNAELRTKLGENAIKSIKHRDANLLAHDFIKVMGVKI